jgi:hypothetical protein
MLEPAPEMVSTRNAQRRIRRRLGRMSLVRGYCVIMSGFQLTASLVSSLIWPAVIVIVIVLLWARRSEIGKFINDNPVSRGRPFRRIKAGPIELEWDQLVELTIDSVRDISGRLERSPVSDELRPMAREDPTAAVLVAFNQVEQALRRLFPQFGKASVSRLAELARSEGLIPEQVWAAVNNLIALRNAAAHRLGDADITPGEAYEYLSISDHVVSILQRLLDERARRSGYPDDEV